MTNEIEDELHNAAERFLIPLRMGDGFDLAAAERVKRSLSAAAVAWSNSSVVSKSAAMLFVDLANAAEACISLYPERDAATIRTKVDEIAALVRECLVSPP
jgi:hypothetical protein